MRIWALSDLHLSFSRPKPMDVFGEHWRDHSTRIERAWLERVDPQDVVCLPGDLSWAMRLPEAQAELAWLGGLPGRKILVKGNHDYWWASISAVRRALPPEAYALQNDSRVFDGVAFAGARGWVDSTLDFQGLSELCPEVKAGSTTLQGSSSEDDDRLYRRELGRLEMSLRTMAAEARFRVVLTHFPPTSPALEETAVTRLLEQYRIDVVVFGHLHGTGPSPFVNPYGTRNGVTYYLVSADFVGFSPFEVAQI
jgi:predicted phosphohydrolase